MALFSVSLVYFDVVFGLQFRRLFQDLREEEIITMNFTATLNELLELVLFQVVDQLFSALKIMGKCLVFRLESNDLLLERVRRFKKLLGEQDILIISSA